MLTRPERETLKDNFSTIEKMSRQTPGGKNGSAQLIRDMIWQVSEQQQGNGKSQPDKVTKKELGALNTSHKKLMTEIVTLLAQNKSNAPAPLGAGLTNILSRSPAQLSASLTKLRGNIEKVKDNFIKSEVNQKKPNMDKAKTIETLSRKLEVLDEKISELDSVKSYKESVRKAQSESQEYALKHRFDPKVQKHFLGDGW
ncbi:Uncharacterised protein [Serratia fonticola]|nr:Uncharacterised protein [Serratia fonticola]